VAKYQNGDLIVLNFDEYNHPEFIKGTVTLEEAEQAISKHYDGEKRVKEVHHQYAFWGIGHDDMGHPCSILYEREEPGRGRFPVTKCTCEWT
jgi:hypothetical protein